MTDTNVQPGTKAPKVAVDWESMEPHYRANIRTLKELGAEYGVSDAGIVKHAKKHGWTRDLAGKIKAKAEAKVSAAAVSAVVSAQTRVREVEVVEANATLQATIRLAHRTDIQRARKLTMSLLEELEAVSDNQVVLRDLAFMLLGEADDKDAMAERMKAFEKAMSVGTRSTTMKTLAESLKTVIALERQAFSIDDKESNAGTLEDWLTKLGD